jgi:hypothetical protein
VTLSPTLMKAFRRGGQVDGADHRRFHQLAGDGGRRGRDGGAGGGRSGLGRGRGVGHRGRRGDSAADGAARDANLQVTLLDLDLGQAGGVEDVGQLAHRAGVDRAGVGRRLKVGGRRIGFGH